ncbi:hypothetical protein CTAYLR_004413 [Chrysophaeum taylorii]|uniref:Nucleotide-diphospho-sugar transferase domain-containing protein n=1 Tax=Chrysophaeum taylorii TaxID=2483200 RepID=A0AAD7ULU0_9STRA|nr:hypothetical protein CTAYLR_004413 [Chrysophaeum taylorii]
MSQSRFVIIIVGLVLLLALACSLFSLRSVVGVVFPSRHTAVSVVFESSSSVAGNFRSSDEIKLPSGSSRLRASSGSSSSSSSSSNTVVIMYDTRPPTPRDSLNKDGENEYWSHAAYLNWLFACNRGYDFRYYLEVNIEQKAEKPRGFLQEGNSGIFKSQLTCYLNRNIGRSTPWCKLGAVADALASGYEWVLILDSDAYFRSSGAQATKSVDDLIKDYRGAYWETGSPDLWLASNSPWGETRGNTGMQIWHNTEAAWKVLRLWWQTDAKATQHAYEQHGFVELMHKHHELRGNFGVLSKLRWMEPDDWEKLPAVHIASFQKAVRINMMMDQVEQEERHGRGRKCKTLVVRRINATAIAEAVLDEDTKPPVSRL